MGLIVQKFGGTSVGTIEADQERPPVGFPLSKPPAISLLSWFRQ